MTECPHRPAIYPLEQIRLGHHEFRQYGEKRERQQYVLWIYLDYVLIIGHRLTVLALWCLCTQMSLILD
jgi:hypothetical protein